MPDENWADDLPACLFEGHHGAGEEEGVPFICYTCGEECW